LLLQRLKKYSLLILCLITLCAFPALAVAEQSRLPEDSSRSAVQPFTSIEDQELMDSNSNRGRFKGYRPVSENSIGVPKDENTPLDLIKVYTTEKQVPASQQETMKIGWIIAPLFSDYTNSTLAAHMPIGVILKIRF
jgi:hypothetical protein